MNRFLHKIELFVDRIIPYLVIILLFVIIFEFSLGRKSETHDPYIKMFYYFVVFVFCVDLAFKYLKIRKIPLFLRKYWIDIVAVFPFFLIFRLFQEV